MHKKEKIMIKQLSWHPQCLPKRKTSIWELRSSGTTASHIRTEHLSWIYSISNVVSRSFAILPFLLSVSKNCVQNAGCWCGQEFSRACVSRFSFLRPRAADFVQTEHQTLMLHCPPLMKPRAQDIWQHLPLLLLRARSTEDHHLLLRLLTKWDPCC